MDNGRTITCMAKASTHGPMEEGMKASTKWIRSTATEFTNGLMGVFMRATGTTVNNTDKANTFFRTAQ